MKKFYNNEDDFLRQRLVDHEFGVLPQAWEQMSALLDSQPMVAKRSAGYYWWGVPVAALLIGAASSFYYYGNKKAPAPATTTTVIDTQPMAAKQQLQTQRKNTTTSTASIVLPTTEAAAKTYTPPKTAKKKRQVVAKHNITTTSTTPKRNSKPAIASVLTATAATSNKMIKKEAAPTVAPYIVVDAAQEDQQQKLSNATTPVTTPRVLSEEQKSRVKKTRTEIIYQYSTTPLRALQERKEQKLGTFGINEEISFKKSPLKFGVTVGGSTHMPSIEGNKLAIRPIIGAHADLKLAKHHHIQLGVQYKNLAIDNETPKMIVSEDGYIRRLDQGLHTIELPLVYKVAPAPKYNFQVGVKPTVVLCGSSKDIEGLVNTKELGISTLDLGVLLGAEYNFNEHWSVGIQYTLGLLNMAKNAASYQTDVFYSDHVYLRSDSYFIRVLDESTSNGLYYVRIPEQIKNSDVQLLLKYNF